jgi:hypothetical protein
VRNHDTEQSHGTKATVSVTISSFVKPEVTFIDKPSQAQTNNGDFRCCSCKMLCVSLSLSLSLVLLRLALTSNAVGQTLSLSSFLSHNKRIKRHFALYILNCCVAPAHSLSCDSIPPPPPTADQHRQSSQPFFNYACHANLLSSLLTYKMAPKSLVDRGFLSGSKTRFETN